jgi:hypothetical protein
MEPNTNLNTEGTKQRTRASLLHTAKITVLHDDREINANDKRYKKRRSFNAITDEEERGSQTEDVNSITLNTLRKVNKGGGYCHKIFEFSFPPTLLCVNWRPPPCPNTTHPTGSKPNFGSKSTTFVSRSAQCITFHSQIV